MSKSELFKKSMKDRRIAVVGLGISNMPLVKYLSQMGAIVTGCDRRSADSLGADFDELKKNGVELRLGEDYLENLDYEIIFKTPSMRFDTPELLAAKQNGAVITSEMEVFFDLCPAPIIGVTGSDGKTTTTTLIYEMLKKQGYTVWIGGNIGRPLLSDIDKIKKDDYVVVELSSFQLHTMKASPFISVITNISPNHLDMHKDYAEYIWAKENIMRHQSKWSRLVVNLDNEITKAIGECAAGECIYFSSCADAEVCIKDEMIYFNGRRILDIGDIKVPGRYNIQNYMAAIGAVGDLVDVENIVEVARNFGGVEHRNEFVRELDGVRYYNSSIDSSPNRTGNTLSVFDEKVILICGGKQKGIPYDELGAVLADKVKVLILLGENIRDIKKSLDMHIKNTGYGKDIMIIYAENYEQAVKSAAEIARCGDCVVLSPASTSFDMFRNFEERGELFKKLVWQL